MATQCRQDSFDFGTAAMVGYEDFNYHDKLRHDPVMRCLGGGAQRGRPHCSSIQIENEAPRRLGVRFQKQRHE